MSKKEKVLLAFSGGLDTTFCAVYMAREMNYEVHTAIVNTGGFSGSELDQIENHARDLGTCSHAVLDATEDYYTSCIKYLLFGNALRNRNYPLSVSSERSFQAMALINHAKKHGFNNIAHGSTAAGNDQVRFDLTARIIEPGINVITPIRKLKISRENELKYLSDNGIRVDLNKAKYSINKGLWGTTIGGKETLTSDNELPGSAFPGGKPVTGTDVVELGFNQGEPCSLNGRTMTPVELIKEIEITGSEYALGRDVHVGDTIIGIKGRVGFSAPAARILIDAHLALEKHVLTKWQLYWKEQIGNWYGMFVHEAQFLEPVMRDMEALLTSSQRNVTGTVSVRLRPYNHSIVGVISKYDLMDDNIASYGEENKSWDAADVDGFTRLIGNQQMIWHRKNTERD
ncbi:MAG: argininosuccinate synthase [Bacteroidales bacterium]|nr:argininosuccinate synthase [Bacteroidales bacterium]